MAGNGALDARDRGAMLSRLATERFDVLVIGGGVTGAGTALDAASRGLRVALVEARDLASGTSSRSSKLIHGGLRYLEQFDFKLVYEALRERDLLVSKLAPHLVKPVSFLYPLYKKVVSRRAKFKAHDETNACRAGDLVRIMETRPLSKDKRWRVVEVVEKAR